MIFNTLLQELEFDSFVNISKELIFAWSMINFLKCFYISKSIKSKSLPPFVIAALFIGITAFFIINTRDFTWFTILQLLDLILIVYTVLTTRDAMFLLSLLTLTVSFLKPFAFIVDVFLSVFLSIDLTLVFWENSSFWSLLNLNCLVLSAAVAQLNSHGLAYHTFAANILYICFYFAVSWNAVDTRKSMPVFVANVVYAIVHFAREEPIMYSLLDVSQLPATVIRAN